MLYPYSIFLLNLLYTQIILIINYYSFSVLLTKDAQNLTHLDKIPPTFELILLFCYSYKNNIYKRQ